MKWTVNLWCIIGIAAALVPILYSWATIEDLQDHCPLASNFSVIDVMQREIDQSEDFGGISVDPLLISAVLFLIGTVVALLTPLGSIIQVGGLITLLLSTAFWTHYDGAFCVFFIQTGLGAFLGFVSAATLIAGLLQPVGLTGKLKLAPSHPRLWTFARCKDI